MDKTNDAAQGAAVVAARYKLVPVEPTDAMLRAGQDAENNDGKIYLRPAWRYMLAAAPAVEVAPGAVPADESISMDQRSRDYILGFNDGAKPMLEGVVTLPPCPPSIDRGAWIMDRLPHADMMAVRSYLDSSTVAVSALAAASPAGPMVDMVPPASARDRWMYEQGRLAERDPRTPAASLTEEGTAQPDMARACDLLSSTIGTLMGHRARIGYADNSPIAALVGEAVEFLRPWPEKLPRVAASAAPAPDCRVTQGHDVGALLLDLLAGIHGDDGRHTNAVGLERSVEDAEAIIRARVAAPAVAVSTSGTGNHYPPAGMALHDLPRAGLRDAVRIASNPAQGATPWHMVHLLRQCLQYLPDLAAMPSEADPACTICNGSGEYCVGTSGREEDGNCPITERCECQRPAAPAVSGEADRSPAGWLVSYGGEWRFHSRHDEAQADRDQYEAYERKEGAAIEHQKARPVFFGAQVVPVEVDGFDARPITLTPLQASGLFNLLGRNIFARRDDWKIELTGDERAGWDLAALFPGRVFIKHPSPAVEPGKGAPSDEELNTFLRFHRTTARLQLVQCALAKWGAPAGAEHPDAARWGSLPAGPRRAMLQARKALTGPVADGLARRCAVAAIDEALASPAERRQHDADSAELARLCQARDHARRERDLARVEVAGLECSVGHLSRLVDHLRPGHDRYAYLRERPVDTISTEAGGVFAGKTPENWVLNGEELDTAIDAAIASQAAKGGEQR